jgi:hypothetical protein
MAFSPKLHQEGCVMADFTPTQGKYLSFISTYTELHGYPPAESEIARAMGVSGPSVNQMVKMLEKKGLILRQPGQARSLQVIVPEEEIPSWKRNQKEELPARSRKASKPVAPVAPVNLYVFSVYLVGGPISKKFANKVVSRTFEIRGDQTLEQFHEAIFDAFDREEEHLYEFQFGKRPYDPNGPNYGSPMGGMDNSGDASVTSIDDLKLNKDRVFGYIFDFGDDWMHQIQVERIEKAIPTVTYPRLIKRVGKSPPQYTEEC